MCWNKEVSLSSFIVGTIINIAVLLYFKKEITVVSFCIIWQFVLLMQLSEYFIWLDQKCGKTNKMGTKAALIFNLMQPVFTFLVLINAFVGSQFAKTVSTIIIFLYLCYMMLKLNENSEYTCTKPSEKCSHMNLKWWNDFKGSGLIYLLTLISVILLLFKPFNTAVFISIYIIIMLVISEKFYSCGQPSTWCWLVVPLPLFLGIFYKLNSKSI